MWFDKLHSRPNARRISGRLVQEGLGSSLGPVLNLSVHGARIATSRPYTGKRTICLTDGQSKIDVNARVIWSRRKGWFSHEIGVQFLDMDPKSARRLTTMCTATRDRRGFALAS
jgi:hypothetical protein